MDWIGNLFAKLGEAFRKNQLTTLEKLEKTRAKVFRKFLKKSLKKDLKKKRKELPNEKFQELIIDKANENLEREATDQRGGPMVEQSDTEKSN